MKKLSLQDVAEQGFSEPARRRRCTTNFKMLVRVEQRVGRSGREKLFCLLKCEY